MDNNELMHYGVLGMKWGVRRARSGSGSKKKKSKAMTPDEKKKASMKKDVKNRRLLSDADLKKKLERIRMEQQLKNITKEELSPGKKFVSDILSSSGKKAATAIVTGATLYAVKKIMTKEKFNAKEAASYMIPNYNLPKQKK